MRNNTNNLEWDEREEIPDPDATKPEDWDKPEHIADPDATKPDDWDDDMDGEWEAPMVDNPDFKGKFRTWNMRTCRRGFLRMN